jgi:hypothetical protein
MPRGPRLVTAAALAALLLVGVVLLRGGGDGESGVVADSGDENDAVVAARSAGRETAPAPVPVPAAASAPTPAAAAPASDVPAGPPDMTGAAPGGESALLPTELVDNGPGRKYMQRYGGQSGRLAQGMPPAERYAPKKMTFGRLPLLIWAADDTLDAGQATTITVEADEHVVITEATITFNGRHGTRRATMQADGGRLARAEFVAPPADHGNTATDRPLTIDAVASVSYVEGGERKTAVVSTMLFLQKSGARLLAGTQRIERSAEGNAILSVDVEVEVPGQYHASAELWGAAGARSIAFSRKSLGNLPAGRHRVALLFGGAVIRDSGIDGPYDVRSLELSRVDTIPPHSARPLPEVLRTPDWRATDFF